MHIIHLVSNKTWGGGEQYVFDLCQALRAEGHTVELIARPVESVTKRFADGGLAPAATMPLRGAIDIVSVMKLARRLRSAGETVVHVHNFKDALVAVRARALSGNDKVRVVLTRHLVKEARTSAMYNDLYARLDAVIFVSQMAMETFLKSAPKIDRAKLYTVHNSIRVPARAKASETPTTTSPEVPAIMHHGRIVPEKGLNVLLDALATLTDLPWRLEIAGMGRPEDVGPLKQQVRRLGLDDRVEWLGFRDDIDSLIRHADIGAVPSQWAEPFGLAVLDYMARGVAVVTTNNGAQPEYLTDEKDALMVPPGSHEALAKALRRLLTDSALRHTIAGEGKRTFDEKLSYDRFLHEITDVYREVVR